MEGEEDLVSGGEGRNLLAGIDVLRPLPLGARGVLNGGGGLRGGFGGQRLAKEPGRWSGFWRGNGGRGSSGSDADGWAEARGSERKKKG